VEGRSGAKNQLDSFIHFDGTPTCDKTGRHRAIASTPHWHFNGSQCTKQDTIIEQYVAVTGESVSLVVVTAKLFHKELDNLWVGHEALQARVHEARVAKIL